MKTAPRPRLTGRGSTSRTKSRLASAYARSRVTLFSLLLVTLPLAISISGALDSVRRLALVMLGFSGIIFLHELGHFVVARLCSVRCDVFSIGIGPRLIGWKKGVGFTFGKSPEDRGAKTEDETAKGSPRGTATFGDIEQTAGASPAATSDAPVEKSAAVPPTGNSKLETGSSPGETDYRVSILPLGGYVRMLGQDDMDPTKVSSDPRSFGRRPIWQRMCIVSAGVVMNVITAAVIFSVIFQPSIGVKFPPAIAGEVMYNSPAANAGVATGFKLDEIDDQKHLGYTEFTDLMIASALSRGVDPVKFAGRDADGKPNTYYPKPSKITGVRFLAVGIMPLPSLQVPSAMADDDWATWNNEIKYTDPAGPTFMRGDRITSITLTDGKPVALEDPTPASTTFDTGYVRLSQQLQKSAGKPVSFTVTNPKRPGPETIVVTPKFLALQSVGDSPGILGLYPRVKLGKIPNGPGKRAGLLEGDIILEVGDGQNILPSAHEFRETVSASPGHAINIKILRDGKEKIITATPEKDQDEETGKPVGRLQVSIADDFEHPIISANENDPHLPGGLRGATITAVNGNKISSFSDIYDVVRAAKPGEELTVNYTTSTNEQSSFTLKNSADPAKPNPLFAPITAPVTAFAYRLDLPLENLNWVQKAGGLVDAAQMGLEHTWKFMQQTYLTLRGLFIHTVSPKELHGIVGIAKVGYDVQERGLTHLWFILAVVSVNLAVANFLPLPIVDGGLFLLLILEKIRGKPLSLKLQSAIQLTGIVALIGLFLFVTWNDILFVAAGK